MSHGHIISKGSLYGGKIARSETRSECAELEMVAHLEKCKVAIQFISFKMFSEIIFFLKTVKVCVEEDQQTLFP